ncbi:site-specific integrase [Marinobacter sp. NFXS11]|uniref:tyrosine-type recombinase/integrase n=1 Tax=Marinobacter sp. NFXS11 TaxID=2818432 RepID=UPI0032DFE114
MKLGDGHIKCVKVDFRNSSIEKVRLLGAAVPQFFDDQLAPIPAANLYMRMMSGRLAVKSLLTLSEHLKELLIWLSNSQLAIEDIDEDAFDYYVEALCVYKKSDGSQLSWNTVNSRASAAHRFLLWTYEQGICPSLNPVEAKNINLSAKRKYQSKGHPSRPLAEPISFLLMEDAIRFVDALGLVSGRTHPHVKRRNILMGAFMLQTGARVSEVCNFPLSDLPEVNSRRISTPARLIGKGAKARVILIPNQLLLQLWEYVDLDRETVSDRISKVSEDCIRQNLFLSDKGQAIATNWVQKLFRKAGQYVGIKSTPHILRHTFGTYHYLLNRDLVGLAKLMGHESETTTHLYYVHTATLVSYSGTYSGLQRELDQMIEASLG